MRNISLRKLVNDRYVTARGVPSGLDSALTDRDIAAFVARKALEGLRGGLQGRPGVYLGAGISIRNGRHLRLERGVAIGARVHIDALSTDGVVIESAATIDAGAILRGSGGVRRLGKGIRIERRAAVGANNFIHGGGGVLIERDVLLGPGVQIFSENHITSDLDRPIIEQGETPGEVRVGSGSWVGACTVVLAGVTIGSGSVIAAGSVVTRSLPDRCVAAGVPARVIKMRGETS